MANLKKPLPIDIFKNYCCTILLLIYIFVSIRLFIFMPVGLLSVSLFVNYFASYEQFVLVFIAFAKHSIFYLENFNMVLLLYEV